METEEICESTGTETMNTPDDLDHQEDTGVSVLSTKTDCDQSGKNGIDNLNPMEIESTVSEEVAINSASSDQSNNAATSNGCVSNDLAKLQNCMETESSVSESVPIDNSSLDQSNNAATESACVSNDFAKLKMDTDMPTTSDSVSTDFQSVKHNMLTHLSKSDAHFKSQQLGEPDLTNQEKYVIAHEKLLKNPGNFLSHFGQFLQQDDLLYFTQFEGQYEIDFYVREIHKQFNKSISAKTVNNRRYSAMQKLSEAGEYFSEEEMKYRAPLLYEEMIGQYLTDDEIQSRVDKTDLKFSSILLKHIDQIEENKLYYYQKNQQECQTEETESDGQEEEEEEEESELESDEETDNKKPKISSTEQQELKIEFLQLMQEKFLTGEDQHFFDYSTVDNNSDYDSLQTIDQDEQDKYFDEDDFD